MIRILVAEDEPVSRAALVTRLRNILGESLLIESAGDGNEAVEKALQVHPDLIFMDVEMPFKTGIEAAAIIKRHCPKTHIVFLTAYDRFDYAVGAIRSGVEDYLLKPIAEPELRETLKKFFEVKEEPEGQVTPFQTALALWIRQHFSEDVALEDAAASMGMSQFYFSRQVKAATGKTFLEFFTEYRIEKAKQCLQVTELSVGDVGRIVGYSDSNYFTKVFKRMTGLTPSQWRLQQDSKNAE